MSLPLHLPSPCKLIGWRSYCPSEANRMLGFYSSYPIFLSEEQRCRFKGSDERDFSLMFLSFMSPPEWEDEMLLVVTITLISSV